MAKIVQRAALSSGMLRINSVSGFAIPTSVGPHIVSSGSPEMLGRWYFGPSLMFGGWGYDGTASPPVKGKAVPIALLVPPDTPGWSGPRPSPY